MQTSRNITDFLNTEYLEYSRCTVEERAIPSLCDGLKPGARKIFHAANTGTLKDGKTYKLLVLSGDTLNRSQYAHGDASLNDTIAEKSKDFVNNLPGLEIEGQGGSLRNPDAVGSPRYLYIRKSKYMDAVYKTDYDLLEYVFDEGMELEPTHYLPIIPTVLTSSAMGIANGYSFHSMAYNPIDIIDGVSHALKGGTSGGTILHPHLRGVRPGSWRFSDGHWESHGKWVCNLSKDVLVVEDLPFDVTYEDFEKLLNKLVEKETITDWKNMSEDGSVHYEVEFPKGALGKCDVIKTFKLVKVLPDDLLWVLDENHRLIHFDRPTDLIDYFTKWRLGLYGIRKKKLVGILEDRYRKNSDLVRFITLVCDGKLIIRNRSKVDIKVDMDSVKLPMELIGTPMSKVTVEERNALLKENEDIKKELEYIRTTSETDMFLNDLSDLRKLLSRDFPSSYTPDTDGTTVGTSRKSSGVIAKEKALKAKEKEKKVREKAKATKDKEKSSKARAKAKATKDKEAKTKKKEKIAKLKSEIASLTEKRASVKAAFEAAKISKNKVNMLKYKTQFTALGDRIKSLKDAVASLKN